MPLYFIWKKKNLSQLCSYMDMDMEITKCTAKVKAMHPLGALKTEAYTRLIGEILRYAVVAH